MLWNEFSVNKDISHLILSAKAPKVVAGGQLILDLKHRCIPHSDDSAQMKKDWIIVLGTEKSVNFN